MKDRRLLLISTIVLGLVLVLSISPCSADTRYVSDMLIITVREGKGNEYKIIKTLKTGTPVEVLEEEQSYYKVRTGDGIEGWVLKRYITADLPKTVIIEGLKDEIERLKGKLDAVEKDRRSLRDEMNAMVSSNAARVKGLEKKLKETGDRSAILSGKLEKMTARYTALAAEAKDIVSLVKERDRLRSDNEKMQSEWGQLRQENEKLLQMQMIWWFLAGGGVFFIGWIAGKLSRKKKRYY